MDDAVRRFRSRRADRMGLIREDNKDAVTRYRERRNLRLKKRFDEENHGNTHIPFGLCEREGIEVQPDWAPKDAWDALKGKGYDPDAVYKELEETGKTPKSPSSPTKTAMTKESAEHVIGEYRNTVKSQTKLEKDREKAKNALRNVQHDKRFAEQQLEYLRQKAQEILDKYGSEENMPEEKTISYLTGMMSVHDEYLNYKELADKEEKALSDYEKKIAKCEDKFKDLDKRYEESRTEEAKKKNEEAKERYYEALKVARPTYDDCQDKQEVVDRLKANKYFKNNEDVAVDIIGFEEAKALAKNLDGFFEKVPQMIGRVGAVSVYGLPNDVYGQSDWAGVQLASKYFRDLRKFKMEYDDSERIGFHPKGTTWESVVFHEYTHQIDNVMSKKGWSFSKAVTDEAIETLKKSGSKLFDGVEESAKKSKYKWMTQEELIKDAERMRVKTAVSEYAFKWKGEEWEDDSEFLAEAYSEYLTSKSPREVATVVGKIVDRYIKDLEGKK